MASPRMLLFVLLATTAALSSALTDEQIAMFMTSDVPETNTGVVGTVSFTTANGMHTITSNGVPDHLTPEYPRKGNPNDITVQAHVWKVPVNPTIAATPTELPMGPIGVAINGIPFFNPYTNEGADAVVTEVFDSCDGHPTNRGVYHYHKQPSSCVFGIVPGQPSPLIGVALDGFPIYGPNDESGRALLSADLDECHGRLVGGQYRYHTTADFPYIMGCFKGVYRRGPGGKPRTSGDDLDGSVVGDNQLDSDVYNGQGRLQVHQVPIILATVIVFVFTNLL